MLKPFRLKSPLGRAYTVDEDDVFDTKTALASLRGYEVPAYGLTPWPDNPLFDSIEAFQSRNRLTTDGYMLPDGETETALNAALASAAERPGGLDSGWARMVATHPG